MSLTNHRGKARVLIHVDERRRDVPVLFALGRLFEQVGYRVILSSRRTTAHFLRRLLFDAVLIPSPEFIPYEEIPRVSSRSRIYMLPTEGALFGELPLMVKYGGGSRPERWERQIQGICRFFLWGDYSRRVLQATGRFREEQLVVVGAPRMDFFMVEASPEEKALWEPSSLGTISDFILTNSCDRQHIFEKIDEQRHNFGIYQASTRSIEDRFWIENAWTRVWLEFFDECQRRGERIKLRIHSREDVGGYRYLRKKYASVLSLEGNELPFEAWLDRLGILFGFNSTTFFEVVAANKPAINLEGVVGGRLREHTDGFPQNHYPIMDYVETPSNMSELFDFVDKVRRGSWTAEHAYGPQARTLLKDVCHFPRSTAALAAIVHTVVEDLEEFPRKKKLIDPVRMVRGCAEARALEFVTFKIKRDRVVGSWFPLLWSATKLERDHAAEISRYLQAAEMFPVSARGTGIGTCGDEPNTPKETVNVPMSVAESSRSGS